MDFDRGELTLETPSLEARVRVVREVEVHIPAKTPQSTRMLHVYHFHRHATGHYISIARNKPHGGASPSSIPAPPAKIESEDCVLSALSYR